MYFIFVSVFHPPLIHELFSCGERATLPAKLIISVISVRVRTLVRVMTSLHAYSQWLIVSVRFPAYITACCLVWHGALL